MSTMSESSFSSARVSSRAKIRRRITRTALLSVVALASVGLTACNEQSKDAAVTTSGDSAELGLTKATGKLVAEGASSQQKAMELFRAAYGAAVPGSTFDYTATGSGSGQKQFINGTVAFGGSDSPLKGEQIEAAAQRCGGNEAWHLPLVIGPVAVAYHIKGVDNLVLSPDVVAKIFSGKISTWDDPAIAALNKGAELPAEKITVIYRSEESGTSDNFQKFLKASAPDDWTTTGKSFPTATGSGANGSNGVVTELAAIDGAVTYVEAGFAQGVKDVGIAELDFGFGPTKLDATSVGKALDKLKYQGEGNNMVVDSDALFAMKEKGAYPLVLTTYEIVCSKGYDDNTRDQVKDFLKVALANQNQALADKGYIPVSGDYAKKLAAAVDAIS